MPRLLAPAAMAALLVAVGVLPTSTGADPSDPPAVVAEFESERCVGMMHAMFLPSPLVQPHIPPGHGQYAQQAPLLTSLRVMAYRCDEVTVGNVTVEDVQFGVSETATNLGFYRWEMFIDEPAPSIIQGALEDAGWLVHPAEFTWNTFGVEIKAESIEYEIKTTLPYVGHNTLHDEFYGDVYQVTPDDDLLLMHERFARGTEGVFYASVLEAEGGVVEDILGPAEPLPGIIQELDTVMAVKLYEPQ